MSSMTGDFGADGEPIGEVDHMIIDKLSGRVAYAVISFGGFMGLGPQSLSDSSVSAPLRHIARRIPHEHYRVAPEDAPPFSENS
jgi:hypothetical protein